jgi:hypothetical protein
MTKTAGTATFTGGVSGGGLTINGTGGTLDLGTSLTHTFTGNWTMTNGTLAGNSSILNLNGTTIGAGGTFVAGTGTVNYKGAAGQTAAGVTYNILKVNNTVGVTLGGPATITTLTIGDVTLNSVFNDGGYVITAGAGSTLSLISGTYNLGSATVGTAWPTWATVSISNGTTIGYVSAFGQAVSVTPGYQNLTFSGAGPKTTDAGNLSISGNWSTTGGIATLNTTNVNIKGNIIGSGPITQGSGLITVSGNWTNSGTFTAGSGGVTYIGAAQIVKGTTYNNLTLGGSGTKTLGAATVTNGSLTVGSGVTLSMSTYLLTLNGDLNNGGTVSGTTGGVIIAGTASQSIGSFTTTGIVSMTKTAGTATFTGGVSGGGLTINGIGGTLDLGPGLVHTFTGAWTRTNGTLLGNTSTLNIGGSASGTGGTFTAGTGTVNYNAAGAQTIAGVTYNNLTLNGSGIKTLGAATVTNGSLMVGSGVTLSMSTYLLTLNGDLNNGGTVSGTTGGVTIAGTASQSIGSFTTTGIVSMTKTAGTATFTGSVNGGAFTLSGNGGTLNLDAGTTGLTHTFTGTFTRTNGILNCSLSTLNLNGTTSGAGGTFNAGAGTVTYGGTAVQTITNVNYYNLGFSGTRTGNITINGAVGIAGTLTNAASFSSGNFVLTGSTFTFNGTAAQTVISLNSVTYPTLTVNNPNGVTLGSNITVTSALTLTSGIITTGSNTLIAYTGTTNATVTRTSGYVYGKLQKYVATGSPTITFEVGTANANDYTPAKIVFSSVTTAGNLTVTSTSGEEPHYSNWPISQTAYVNVYWTLTNSTIAGGSYTVDLTWLNTDLMGGAVYSSLNGAQYISSWGSKLTPSIRNTNDTTLNGSGSGFTTNSGFGDFVLGN